MIARVALVSIGFLLMAVGLWLSLRKKGSSGVLWAGAALAGLILFLAGCLLIFVPHFFSD